MSDVHQGSTDNAPAPSPAHIDNPIEGGSTADQIKESVQALNEQRAQRGEAAELDREPVRLRYSEGGTKSLRQAAKDVSNYHRLEKEDATWLKQTPEATNFDAWNHTERRLRL